MNMTEILSTVPDYFAYYGTSIAMWLIGVFLFSVTTKNKEITLIQTGNKSAAFMFGGKALALAMVLNETAANSTSVLDLVLWGAIAIVTQIVVFIILEVATPKFSFYQAIEEDNVAVGIGMMFISIAIAYLISGNLTV